MFSLSRIRSSIFLRGKSTLPMIAWIFSAFIVSHTHFAQAKSVSQTKAAKKKALSQPVKLIKKNHYQVSAVWLNNRVSDPNILFQAQALPYKDPSTDKMLGFRLVSFDKGSAYDLLALKEGDVIVEANQRPLGSLMAAQELYQSLSSVPGSKHVIKVLRGTKTLTLHYAIK